MLPARVLKNQHSLILPSSSLILPVFPSQRRHKSESSPGPVSDNAIHPVKIVVPGALRLERQLFRLEFSSVCCLLKQEAFRSLIDETNVTSAILNSISAANT